ncbi:MAG: SCO family protein, partial [Burkholderiales bacterium]
MMMTRLILAAILAFGSGSTFALLPRDSVYQLDAVMEDQDGRSRPWSANRGEVRIVTMFYSSCPHACPLIVETIKAVEAAVPAAERSRLKVDLLSFDHERDTPAHLKKMVAQRSIDESRWHLYRTDDASARRL